MNNTRVVTTAQDRRGVQPASRGFTLIEVLVVLGILAVLAAITLPVFSHAREKARRTACQSNLRQITVAMQQYVQDSGGVYPPDVAVHQFNSDGSSALWHDLLLPYTDNREIFRCPDHAPEVFGRVGYTFNSNRLNLFERDHIKGIHESQFSHSSTIWLTRDTAASRRDGSFIYTRLVTATSCGRGFMGSTIHGGGGNYSFVDGHVKWHTPEAMAEIDCTNPPVSF